MTITRGRTDLSDVESDNAPAWRGLAAIEASTAADAAGQVERANEAARKAVAALAALVDPGVADSDASPAAGTSLDDVDAQAVTHEWNGEPSAYEFTVTGPGLVVDEYEISLAAGSGVEGTSADPWLDENIARTELPRMGWCVGLADVLGAAYTGDLHADTSGIVRRHEGLGRRVRAALVELLASGGYIAVPRAGRRGPVTVTPDGVTAHRWCVAAPDLLHADERTAYRARVRRG
ncbi:hypothetical protein ACH4Y0_02580 [Streptomyces sp. NPDC020707]|uniref:hypothetical protein n=1 Tax=Streptomyces sp. NPDC020707 TaxID=3365084 RepID=UPI00379BC268